jgi:hypothetical protein
MNLPKSGSTPVKLDGVLEALRAGRPADELLRSLESPAERNVSIVLRHFFRKITVEASPPSPVDPACALPGRQAY